MLKQKLDEYDLAKNKIPRISNQKDKSDQRQSEDQKLIKQLQVIRVEIDIRRAEAIQIIQARDGKQYEKLQKNLHALLTPANQWDWKDYEKYSNFKVKRGNIKSRLSTIYPIAYYFDKDANWKGKYTRLLSLINPFNSVHFPKGDYPGKLTQ